MVLVLIFRDVSCRRSGTSSLSWRHVPAAVLEPSGGVVSGDEGHGLGDGPVEGFAFPRGGSSDGVLELGLELIRQPTAVITSSRTHVESKRGFHLALGLHCCVVPLRLPDQLQFAYHSAARLG